MEPTAIETILADDRFVRALARRLVRDAATADDVTQAAYVEAIGRRPDGSSPRGWIATVVKHVAANLRRGEDRRTRHERAAARADVQAPESLLVEREEVRQKLVAAVLQLGPPRSTVLILRYFEDLPPRTIAARLGMQVETVRTHLKRAHAELRARLGSDRRGDGSSLLAALPLLLPAARFEPAAIGVALMTAKSKAALVVIAAAIATISWFAVRPADDAGPLSSGARGEVVVLEDSKAQSAPIDAPEAERIERAPLEPRTEPTQTATAASEPAVTTLRGVVLDAAGAPVAGALVQGSPASVPVRSIDEGAVLDQLVQGDAAPKVDSISPDGQFRARSRTDGSFEVRGLPPHDSFTLAASSADHGVVVVTGVPVRAEETSTVTLRFERGVVLHGRVSNEAGGAVPAAHVQVMATKDGEQYGVLLYLDVAEDGAWRTPPLARIGFHLSASADGFLTEHRSLSCDPQRERELRADFHLVPAPVLRGRFVDERGAPARLSAALVQRGIELAGGHVAVFGSYEDPTGDASFRDLGHDEGTIAWDADRWELVPDDTERRYVSLWCGSTLLGVARAETGAETDVVVHLDRLPSAQAKRAIVVRVVDDERHGIAGAAGRMRPAFEQPGGSDGPRPTFAPDAARPGTLRVDDVTAGVYDLRVTAPGFVPRRMTLVVDAGDGALEFEVALPVAGRSATVVVRDASGAPIEGVRLHVLDAANEVADVARELATNQEGRKVIEGLGLGEYTILASHARYGATGVRVRVDDGLGEIVITLAEAIEVRVDAGTTDGPFSLRVLDATGLVVHEDACIDSRRFGSGFTLRLAPGRHTVVVRSPGFAPGSATVDVVPGAKVAVALTPLAR